MRSALEHSLGFRGNSELTNNKSRIIASYKVSGIFEEKFICVHNFVIRMFHSLKVIWLIKVPQGMLKLMCY